MQAWVQHPKLPGVIDALGLSSKASMTPAGSNIGEYYQVL